MKWQLLNKTELDKFIDNVKSSDAAVLFKPVTSEGKTTALPFYTNIQLYRLTSFASMPIFTLHFLSDGQRFFYLDGSHTPLYMVNDLHGLRLTSGNILAYLNFYFFSVAQPQGDVFLIHDPNTYPFQDTAHFDVMPPARLGLGTAPNYQITPEDDGNFTIETPLFMDGTMVRATLHVTANGRVRIVDQKMIVGDTQYIPNRAQ